MRAVLQRVTSASVEVDGKVVSSIGPGLLCLIGVHEADTEADAEFICRKVLNLRLWSNEASGKPWDQSVMQRGYGVLCVSQFTLCGRFQGNKPDFSKAMPPDKAREQYERLLQRMRGSYPGGSVQDGVFGAMMAVSLVNDGPVTWTLDSHTQAGNRSTASMSSLDAAR